MVLQGMVLMIQIIAMVVPTAGCYILIKKESGRSSMLLLIANIACFILNSSHLIMMRQKTAEGALSIFKIEFLGSSVLYLSLFLFLFYDQKILNYQWTRVFLFFYLVMEVFFHVLLWGNDSTELIFRELTFTWNSRGGFLMVENTPGIIFILHRLVIISIFIFCLIYTIKKRGITIRSSLRKNMGFQIASGLLIALALVVSLMVKIRFHIVPVVSSAAVFLQVLGFIKKESLRVVQRGREWSLDHAECMMITTDSEYQYLESNAYAKEFFPELGEAFVGKRLPDHLLVYFSAQEEETDGMYEIEERYFSRELKEICQKEEILGYSLILYDRTRERRLEEELSVTNQQKEEAEKEKTEFIANISHEIRTPMSAIVGMTEILLRESLPTRSKEYLKNIKKSADALLTISDDMLDPVEPESVNLGLFEEEYEPMSLFHDLSMIFLNRIGGKPVELLYEIDPNLPAELYGDVQKIRQIILQFVNQAIKFTENGFIRLTLKTDVSSLKKENKVRMSFVIQDSSQGITQEEQKELEDSDSFILLQQYAEQMGGTLEIESTLEKGTTVRFQIVQMLLENQPAAQLKDETAKEHIVGIRISNPILRTTVEDLCASYGVIHVDCMLELSDVVSLVITDGSELFSTEEYHTMSQKEIKVYLLRNPMQEYDIHSIGIPVNKPLYSLNFCQILNGETTSSSDVMNEVSDFIAPEARILLVDDNEMNRKVALSLIEPFQVDADTAADGEEALRKIQETVYDLVIMDYKMPTKDGIAAAEELRAMEGEYFRTLPVIALSAQTDSETTKKFYTSGMNDYIVKPIRVKDLKNCLLKWLPEKKLIHWEERSSEIDVKAEPLQESGIVTEVGNALEENPEVEAIMGLDVQTGLSACGSKEEFYRCLGEFYLAIDEKSQKLEGTLKEQRLEEYIKEVEMLQKEAKKIGAIGLAEEFSHLEKLWKEERIEELKLETPEVLEFYEQYKPILEPYRSFSH